MEGGGSRVYSCIKKPLEKRKYLLKAVGFTLLGSDLVADWKNCIHPKFARYQGWWWLFFLYGGIIYTLFFYRSLKIKKGFQVQESDSLLLSVLATLEQAIEECGIPRGDISREGSRVKVETPFINFKS